MSWDYAAGHMDVLQKAVLLDFDFSITNGIVSSKIYDTRDDFNFTIIANFPFLDRDVPGFSSYDVYFAVYPFCESMF